MSYCIYAVRDGEIIYDFNRTYTCIKPLFHDSSMVGFFDDKDNFLGAIPREKITVSLTKEIKEDKV